MDAAKSELKRAQESGDADAIAAAQTAVNSALSGYEDAKRALDAAEEGMSSSGQSVSKAREELKRVTAAGTKK